VNDQTLQVIDAVLAAGILTQNGLMVMTRMRERYVAERDAATVAGLPGIPAARWEAMMDDAAESARKALDD
jgi:hypothetical protein